MVKKLTKPVKERPRVVLPRQNRLSRYVQLYIDKEPYLRCEEGSRVDDTGKILERTLKEFRIKEYGRQCFRPGDVWYPVFKGLRYEVVGSGNCWLHRENLGKAGAGVMLLGAEQISCLYLAMDTQDFRDYPLGVDWRHLDLLKHDREFCKIRALRLVKNINTLGAVENNLL